jgi:hypothetical protein
VQFSRNCYSGTKESLSPRTVCSFALERNRSHFLKECLKIFGESRVGENARTDSVGKLPVPSTVAVLFASTPIQRAVLAVNQRGVANRPVRTLNDGTPLSYHSPSRCLAEAPARRLCSQRHSDGYICLTSPSREDKTSTGCRPRSRGRPHHWPLLARSRWSCRLLSDRPTSSPDHRRLLD